MKNNHSYILLLLCVLLIFILIQKNREYFENKSDEKKWEIELMNTFNTEKKELDLFLEKHKEKIKSNSYLKKIDLTMKYNQIINNKELEEYKKNIEIYKDDNLKIYFTHKLFEADEKDKEEDNNNNKNEEQKDEDEDKDKDDVLGFRIYYLLLVIELDPDNQNHRLITFKLLTENPSEIFPTLKLVPDTSKFKKMKNKFEDKIGSMPDPSECVIS